jgi:hypothetical protein
MKINPEIKKVHCDKTDWKKVVAQSDSQVSKNAQSDPDSPMLTNKKYYKPEKNKSQ